MAKPSLSTAALTTSLLLGTGVAVHDVSSHRAHETVAAAVQEGVPSHPSLESEGPCGVIRRFFAERREFENVVSEPKDRYVLIPERGQVRVTEASDEPFEATSNCGERYPIRYLIATLPHPTQTKLGLTFDRYVESIMGAAGSAGYTFHAYWLPWAEAEAADAGEGRRKHEEGRKARERVPGILLFRGPPEKARSMPSAPLAILLVTETPASGINEAALHAALRIIPEVSQRKVPIAGPSFSGSFWSLKHVIDQYPNLAFRVVTGSATVRSEWDGFQSDGRFSATVYDDASAIGTLFQFIYNELDPTARVALLSESATAYGLSGRAAAEKKTSGDWSKVLKYTVTFPREISRLRNAHGEHPELSAVTENKAQGPASNLLPLELRDLRSGNDTVPLLAQTQTPISQEAVLQNIARALRSRHIEFALVQATDPLDVVFLAGYLRTNCPDVRMLTIGADVLYARAALENPLSGTLSATSYPLFPQGWTRKWKDGRTNYIPFPSAEAQGVFNATALLLEEAGYTPEAKLEDYRRPFCSGGRADAECGASGAPAELTWRRALVSDSKAAPALWLTVLSRTGYWPVAAFGASESSLPRALVPTLSYEICGFLLLGFFGVCLWRMRPSLPRSTRPPAAMRSAVYRDGFGGGAVRSVPGESGRHAARCLQHRAVCRTGCPGCRGPGARAAAVAPSRGTAVDRVATRRRAGAFLNRLHVPVREAGASGTYLPGVPFLQPVQRSVARGAAAVVADRGLLVGGDALLPPPPRAGVGGKAPCGGVVEMPET